MSNGSRTPALTTAVPSPTDLVSVATAANATNGETVTPGWSAAQSTSKPIASTRLACETQAPASVGAAWTAKEIFPGIAHVLAQSYMNQTARLSASSSLVAGRSRWFGAD